MIYILLMNHIQGCEATHLQLRGVEARRLLEVLKEAALLADKWGVSVHWTKCKRPSIPH
jgi:hypothetical protein